MDDKTFNDILEEQIDTVYKILATKAGEYSDGEDRLSNFKQAAHLQGLTPRQALAGMMAKHTVSVFDMATSTDEFEMSQWNEKITDHINYLILLRAVVEEEKHDLTTSNQPKISPKDWEERVQVAAKAVRESAMSLRDIDVPGLIGVGYPKN